METDSPGKRLGGKAHDFKGDHTVMRHVPKMAFALVLAVATYLSVGTGPRLLRTEHVQLWHEGVSTEEAEKCLAKADELYGPQEQGVILKLRLVRDSGALRLSFENVNLDTLSHEDVASFRDFASRLAEAIREPLEVELTNGYVGDSRQLGTVAAGSAAKPQETNPVRSL